MENTISKKRAAKRRISKKTSWVHLRGVDPHAWSTYDDIVAPVTPAAIEYKVSPLASCPRRGYISEEIVRRFLQLQGRNVTLAEKVPGKGYGCFDLRENSTKIEVKSAQFTMARGGISGDYWVLRFRNIKWDEFHKLILVMHLPTSIRFYEYSGSQGQTTAGWLQEFTGGTLQFMSSLHSDFENAVVQVHTRLAGMHIGTISLDDVRFSDLTLWNANMDPYFESPLFGMSTQKAGLLLEKVARRFVELKWNTLTSDASTRHMDWMVDGVRYEVKSARLCNDRGKYKVLFQKIRRDHHDRLILVFHLQN